MALAKLYYGTPDLLLIVKLVVVSTLQITVQGTQDTAHTTRSLYPLLAYAHACLLLPIFSSSYHTELKFGRRNILSMYAMQISGRSANDGEDPQIAQNCCINYLSRLKTFMST